MIPGGLALGYMHRNRSKEFIKQQNQGLVSSTQETYQKRRIEPKTQEKRGGRDAQHTQVNLKQISSINLRGIHLYKG